MHDCRKTKDDLIDLVFNELEGAEEMGLLEEIEACRFCRAEYQSMQETLNGFNQAALALIPSGEFWTEHHARLEEQMEKFSGATQKSSSPFWQRAFRTSFTIPAPIGIAAALLLAATSVLAIRSFIFRPEVKATTTEASAVKVQYVEVPVEKRVVEERVLTRTVYVNKRSRTNGPNAPALQDLPGMTAQNKDERTNAPRTTLNGFQPPSDVKLTVIKGSFNDEK
jgi:hypothetical protein